MADVPTAVDVGNIITYVAPGFFASRLYAHPYSRPEKEQFNVLVVSAAASLPLVAAANEASSRLGIEVNPTSAEYAFLLVGIAILAGLALRVARDSRLAIAKLKFAPRGTILSTRLLRNLPSDSSTVTVTFKAGRILSGTPQSGTGDPDSPARELYLTYPSWWDAAKNGIGGWTPAPETGGVIVNLDDVEIIELADDPLETPSEPGILRRWFRRLLVWLGFGQQVGAADGDG
jgi:hypothetical protein